MKHLLYSDAHLKLENLEYCRVVFDAIGEGAEKHGVISSGGYVVNGGDLFNERGIIRTAIFDMLVSYRRDWSQKKIRHIDNVGNHDQEDRNGETHPLRVFSELPGSIVISQPTLIKDVNWWFFPYSHSLRDQIFKVSHTARPFITAFVHAGVKDAWRNDKSQDTDGIPTEHFKSFKKVFSGHYHFRHAFDNVQYIGSTMQHSLAEAGQDKGYLIYDDKKGTVDFHHIHGTPRHYEVAVTWSDKGKMIVTPPEYGEPSSIDHVRFTLRGEGVYIKKVKREDLQKIYSTNSVKIRREITDETMSRLALDEKDHADIQTLTRKYVQHLEPALDQDRLLKIGAKLLET